MYWIIYGNSRAKSTGDLLALFWMVEPLSCRSFHKRDQEICRTFLSSINIEHCPKYIKKTGTDHCWCLRSELQTEQPFAMTQSLNRLRRFPPHGPFARSRKHGFPNIYIYILMICFPMFFINFSRYFGQGRRFLPPGTFTFPTFSIHVLLETRSTMF